MTTYRIGSVEIQPEERRLLIDRQPVHVGARAFDVLLALFERRGHLVTKNELLDLAWPGVVVDENNLQVQISTLRKVLGPALITTIPGRGYRLVEPPMQEAAGASRAAEGVTSWRGADRNGNVPAHTQPLVGRDGDLDALRALIAAHPLVTVCGTGGIGKTALALAAASALRDQFEEGAWIVDLSGVSDPARVTDAVTRTLGINLSGPQESCDRLAGMLGGQRILLVLDTCEHVVDGAGAIARSIGAHAPGVRVVATSREPLNVPGEYVFRLEGLEVPGAEELPRLADHGAVELFFRRARSVVPDIAVSAGNAAAAAAICRQLDGLPLAIELAAARVRSLGVDGVREKLSEPLRLLSRSARTAAPRHQTLQATIAWSHDLLSAAERVVFRRLGVFAGGFPLELAQQVARDETLDEWGVLDALGNLVEKSMVVATGSDRPRYRLLDTLRAFALEALRLSGEAADRRQRHAHAVCEWFVRADDARFGEQGTLSLGAWVERLAPELDNARVALDWATGDPGDAALAVALAGASAGVFKRTGASQEALRRMNAIEPHADTAADKASAARFRSGFGLLGSNGRLPIDTVRAAWNRAVHHYHELDARRRLHFSLCGMAIAMNTTGAPEAAEALMAEIAQLEQPTWPAWYRANRLGVRGHTYYHQRRFDDFVAIVREEHALLAREPGEGDNLLGCEADICFGLVCLGRYEEAGRMAESLLARIDGTAPQLAALVLMYLMDTQLLQGRLDEATATLRRALPRWRRADMTFFCCVGVATLLAEQGRFAGAARLDGVETRFRRTKIPRRPGTTALRERTLALLQSSGVDPAELEKWRREGESLEEPQIAALCADACEETRSRGSGG